MELRGPDTTLAISGVGGFIGLRMTQRAGERGVRVRGLDVSADAARRAELAGADVIIGDVCDPAVARRLCDGADVVFHTAAIVSEAGAMELFRRVNVEGTRTVAEAARDAGVERFVQLSSVAVYGFDYPPYVDENGPLRGEGNPYCVTKIESEQVATSYHEPGGMEVIAIRPGDVYGPGSVPWVVRPIDYMRQGLFVLVDGGRGIMNHVYVDNLLDAVFLTLEQDATGEVFNVTDGASTTFAEYFDRLGRMVGRSWLPSVPSSVLGPVLSLVSKGVGLLGLHSPMPPESIRFVARPYPYSTDKARRVLGYEPRVSLDEGMREVERWVRASG